MFGNGANYQELLRNSTCGRSESRVFTVRCDVKDWRDYRDPDRYYSGAFPYNCQLLGPYPGCTSFGCELDEGEGATRFGEIDDDKQHAAVQCRCRDGFEFNSTSAECVRLEYQGGAIYDICFFI